jgi:hypothetical protein
VRGDGLIPGGSFRYPGRQCKVPPNLRHLDLDLVGKALFETNGNITRAAEILDVDSADLRRFAWAKPELIALIDELIECRLDRAEARLHEAIESDDLPLAARMAVWFLSHHERGRARGYLASSSPSAAGAVTVTVAMPHYTWADGSELPQRHTVPPAIPTVDEASIDEPLIDDSRDEESEIASAPSADEPPADEGPPDEMPPDEQPADEPLGLE